MRSIAESQADWLKAIALAKGLPRNVVIPPPPPPDDDDDDDEDGGEPVPSSSRPSDIETVATLLAPYVPELMDSWRSKRPASNDQRAPVNSMAHLARIQAQLTRHERKLLEMLPRVATRSPRTSRTSQSTRWWRSSGAEGRARRPRSPRRHEWSR